jgi:hypothetical protein
VSITSSLAPNSRSATRTDNHMYQALPPTRASGEITSRLSSQAPTAKSTNAPAPRLASMPHSGSAAAPPALPSKHHWTAPVQTPTWARGCSTTGRLMPVYVLLHAPLRATTMLLIPLKLESPRPASFQHVHAHEELTASWANLCNSKTCFRIPARTWNSSASEEQCEILIPSLPTIVLGNLEQHLPDKHLPVPWQRSLYHRLKCDLLQRNKRRTARPVFQQPELRCLWQCMWWRPILLQRPMPVPGSPDVLLGQMYRHVLGCEKLW